MDVPAHMFIFGLRIVDTDAWLSAGVAVPPVSDVWPSAKAALPL